MSNSLSFVGKVINVKYKAEGEVAKSSLLDISINVPSGDRKKEGQDYPPSFIVNVPIWGAYADSLKDKIFQGQRLFVQAGVQEVNSYLDKEGNPAGNLRLFNASIKPIDWPEEDQAVSKVPEKTTSAKTETKKSNKKSKEFDEEFADLDALLDDEE